MDEAILIEIAQRFRKLEDLNEKADLYLTAEQERMRFFGDKAKLQELRDDVEAAFERCRDDMVSMQEAIRRHFDPTAPKAAKSIP